LIDLRDASAPAEAVIEALELRPHPEGGHYRETWRDRPADGSRGAATAILFLLCEAELWLWQAGAPLLLRIDADTRWVLGPELAAQRLQCVVPRDCWQSAYSLGAWTLCSCIVAPAFDFSGFELAPRDWRPEPASCPGARHE
jgi:predicted cupin superfamily sugar epimerase